MLFFYENKGQDIVTTYGTHLSDLAHLHNHLELVYMIDGDASAFLENQDYPLHSGELFLAFPNQIHKYDHPHPGKLILLIFPPELCPEFQVLFSRSLPVSPVLHDVESCPRLVRLLHEIVEINDPEAPYNATEIRGLFLALLSEIFRRMRFAPTASLDNNVVRDLLNYCTKHYTGDLRLEAVSEALHINKYYISHLFTQKLHMKFNEYVGMLRVSAALRLLDSGEDSITNIAYRVGFNSTRSFNRLFFKYQNVTPRDYRLSRLQKAE